MRAKITKIMAKNHHKFLSPLILIFSLIWASAGFAAAGDKYLLPKFGFMTIDVEDADSLLTLGCEFGYGLSQNVSLEAELNYGFSGGAYRNAVKNIQGEFRIATVAGYGVYRLAWGETGYFKIKGGVHAENIERTTGPIELSASTSETKTSKQDVGFAGGIGIGGRMDSNITLELELTGIDQKIRLLSLGMHYNF